MNPHIAVNTRLLLPGRQEGISRFAIEVLRRMTQRNPDVNFSFFFDRTYDPTYVFHSNVQPYVLPPQARHPVLWYTWFHGVASWKLRQLTPNVFFSPEFYLCPNAQLPQVPVFHDLAYEHYPEDIGKWAARYCRKYSPQYAQSATKILTVSEYSRQDIVYQYGIEEGKIHVVYNGVGENYAPIPTQEREKVRERYSQGCPYFLFVGTVQPRKNLETLLKAFDIFRSKVSIPIKLLIAGRRGWQVEKVIETYQLMQNRDEVAFTGFVPEEDLPKLYGAATALCYIPYLEGFGIPLLEAMACDCPILCSNVSSLPEVAGEAALQVDPFDTEQISQGLMRLWTDKVFRENLIKKGREQKKNYSWDRTYDEVWKVLQQFL
ncbi:MAG: glycosyltransferase family 1 protein [Bacteroidota bacterium]